SSGLKIRVSVVRIRPRAPSSQRFVVQCPVAASGQTPFFRAAHIPEQGRDRTVSPEAKMAASSELHLSMRRRLVTGRTKRVVL
ncbi:MAG: hypothetical protein VW619_00980, partial [Rhodobiaceae bacterium]